MTTSPPPTAKRHYLSHATVGEEVLVPGSILIGDHNTVTCHGVTIKGNHNFITGYDLKVTGSFNQIYGHSIEASGNHLLLEGSDSTVEGQHIQTRGQRIQAMGAMISSEEVRSPHGLATAPASRQRQDWMQMVFGDLTMGDLFPRDAHPGTRPTPTLKRGDTMFVGVTPGTRSPAVVHGPGIYTSASASDDGTAPRPAKRARAQSTVTITELPPS